MSDASRAIDPRFTDVLDAYANCVYAKGFADGARVPLTEEQIAAYAAAANALDDLLEIAHLPVLLSGSVSEEARTNSPDPLREKGEADAKRTMNEIFGEGYVT